MLPYLNSVDKEDKIGVKMRGLPWRVTYDEVAEFFKDFKMVEKSIVLGIGPDGRKDGYGVCLFQDETECQAAVSQMNEQHIGQRYIRLGAISYGEYLRFK
jgi:RNA recognition motif-containing protein